MLTWAFEFEDQPYFDGFRTLATNGIDKPVLNVFRMDGIPEAWADIRMTVAGVPPTATASCFAITALMKRMAIPTRPGSRWVRRRIRRPINPRLEAAGQLELFDSPRWLKSNKGSVDVNFVLPRPGSFAAGVELVDPRASIHAAPIQ